MSTRLFEQGQDNNPAESYKIAFGKAAAATLNMTFTNFFAYLRSKIGASETDKGLIEIATQTEVNTGTDDTRAVTPLKLANYTPGGVKQKVLAIGPWGMNVSAGPAPIAHGLDFTKIRSVDVYILNDAQNSMYPLLAQSDPVDAITVGSASIFLYRQHLGYFHNSNFADLFVNRGWVVINHTP